jgi:hypothetical protein
MCEMMTAKKGILSVAAIAFIAAIGPILVIDLVVPINVYASDDGMPWCGFHPPGTPRPTSLALMQ